jgi:hypothetical protein
MKSTDTDSARGTYHFVVEAVGAVVVVDSKQERLITNCAVTRKYVSGLSLKC